MLDQYAGYASVAKWNQMLFTTQPLRKDPAQCGFHTKYPLEQQRGFGDNVFISPFEHSSISTTLNKFADDSTTQVRHGQLPRKRPGSDVPMRQKRPCSDVVTSHDVRYVRCRRSSRRAKSSASKLAKAFARLRRSPAACLLPSC